MRKMMSIEQIQKLRQEEAARLRREMVNQVNANQRLEGYEPDEQLQQLQERFIAGTMDTKEMIEVLTEYARKISTRRTDG